MAEKLSKSEKLFEEALDLIIRLQDDPDNSVTLELVNRWRARGQIHENAWQEAMEIHGMAGKVMQDRRRRLSPQPRLSRRAIVTGGLTGIAALGTASLLGPQFVLEARADYLTRTAEVKNISLADGTRVTLGPDSAIKTRSEAKIRRVELLAGMAYFDVAPDPQRPFQVASDALTATALGTAFDVSNDAGFVTVSVDHGTVALDMPITSTKVPSPLDIGEWLTFDPRSRTHERGKRDQNQIAAWRDGMLISDHDTISSVVARIARWQSGRVVLAEASFGAQRISGVFDLSDPLAALDAVVEPYGGRVRQVSRWLTIVSSI